MVYSTNFVAVIKHNGKILRESKNVLGESVVQIPFKADYSVLLKNLDSRSAVVTISVDGKKAAENIIVRGNTDVEIKGFLDGLKVRNRFRFIKKTEEIVKHRGDRIDDGIVRVEYKFEERQPVQIWPYQYYNWPKKSIYNDSNPIWYYQDSQTYCGTVTCNYIAESTRSINPEEGITVPGAKTNQDFIYGNVGTLETNSYVITIKLNGYSNHKVEVKKAITVKTRLQCSTCGRKWKSHYRFCPNCSTAL